MFVAVSSQCFSDVNFATACQNAADLGYDKIELWLNEASDHLKPSQIVASPTKFFQLYRETTRLTPVAFNLQEDVQLDVFEDLCKVSKMLKITQITMPAATLGTPFNEEIDRLRSRLAASNSAGIRLSLKTKTGHLTEDPQTAVELCQAVPGLGLTLDVSYYICGRYAGQSYDQVYPYVYHTHLRDTTPSQVQVPVGLGEVDYSRIISQLRRFNYNRALSVEILPDYLQGNDRALELRKIRMLLETLL
ncbi:MAG: sugar phosphate isomerase/epimerase [Schlesneria sp.]